MVEEEKVYEVEMHLVDEIKVMLQCRWYKERYQ